MEDYTKYPASRLYGLLQFADCDLAWRYDFRKGGDHSELESKRAAITAELDARCEKYKLRIGATGRFEASEDCFDKLFGGYGRFNIDPAEFIGLGNYILSKTK